MNTENLNIQIAIWTNFKTLTLEFNIASWIKSNQIMWDLEHLKLQRILDTVREDTV